MFDKEIEAIAKCTELIKDLEDSAKVRVLKYLIERFEIGTNPVFRPPSDNTSKLLTTPVSENLTDISSETVPDQSQDFPSLKELLIKNYPKNETEWILCYSFYASNFGNDTFTKDDITDRYKENNRFSENARKNFTANLNACIKKDWIKPVNHDYILKAEGIAYAKEIMEGNSNAKERKIIKRKTTSNGNE